MTISLFSVDIRHSVNICVNITSLLSAYTSLLKYARIPPPDADRSHFHFLGKHTSHLSEHTFLLSKYTPLLQHACLSPPAAARHPSCKGPLLSKCAVLLTEHVSFE